MPKTKAQKAYDLAYKYENEWGVCSQATIKALLDVYNIDNNDFFKVLSGLGGGGADQGDGMCGAYLAGAFFLGLEFGRNTYDIGVDPDDLRGSKKNRILKPLVKKLHDKFIEKYGTITCNLIHRKLYGRPFYLLDKDEKEKFELAGGHDWGCTSVCGNAARWTVEILEEAKKNKK